MTKTNLITGFLGSGKTTAIRHLLTQKPEHEKWTVLVNEFGEIGIDRALLANSGAVLKEIPGGCMCCVNGLPMQIGLNMLLQQAKPDRLLIEPTGLGHPKQILNLLTSEVYQPWINLLATVCLLDARQINSSRYSENENFRNQLAAADIIIANKWDTYRDADNEALNLWSIENAQQRPIYHAVQGNINATLLDEYRHNRRILTDGNHHHISQAPKGLTALNLHNYEPWRRALNQGQGYFSCSWVFHADIIFNTLPLLEWVRLSQVERIKGVMRISEGTLIINRQGDDLQIETRQAPPPDSRIEVINPTITNWNALQAGLLATRLNNSGV